MKKKNGNGRQSQSENGSAGNVIAGRLIHKATKTPIYPALIEAYDNEDTGRGALGRAEVYRSGAFTIKTDERPKGSSAGEIALYVFDEERTKVLSREPIIVRFGGEEAREIIIDV